MRTVSLSGSLRKSVGKKEARRLRAQGLVPCVMYGGKEQKHFFTQEKQFKDIVYTNKPCFIDLTIDGEKHRVILQEVQFHPVTDRIIHADFYEFSEEKPIKMYIPVSVKGNSPGVMKGGKLNIKYRSVPVKALPSKMPEEIILDISNLEIGDKIRVKNLSNPDYTLLLPENNVMVAILMSRAAMENQQAQSQ